MKAPCISFKVALALVFMLLVTACSGPKLKQLEDSFACGSPLAKTLPIGFTTEQQTFLPDHANFYRELVPCEGWRRYTRTDLAKPGNRETPPEHLLSLVHLSDAHILDAESPLRVEYLRHRHGLELSKYEFQAGFRPQETMTTQVTESMIRQLNKIKYGPVTNRRFDLAVSTGDTGDNHQLNELEWFINLFNGGRVNPNSGGSEHSYEGVQDNTSSPLFCQYWHPNPVPVKENPCKMERKGVCGERCEDKFKLNQGFPTIPGLLKASRQPFTAKGLKIPWYTTYGNHDELVQGNFSIRTQLPPTMALDRIAKGPSKLIELPKRLQSPDPLIQHILVDEFLLEFLNPWRGSGDWNQLLEDWTSKEARQVGQVRQVTSDRNRALWTRKEYIQKFLDEKKSGPCGPIGKRRPCGPIGHGFKQTNLETGNLYYSFDLISVPTRIRGVVLDTTNPNGMANGSLDREQVRWMETELEKVHSQYYARDGRLVKTGNKDALVFLFSHHDLNTLDNWLPDPHHLLTRRVLKTEFEKIVHRYPNVILWLNGHTHFSRIFPRPDKTERTGGFWEINTPSLIDFPQMARIVELDNNRDGTLSVFATLVDHAAPAKYTDTLKKHHLILWLASISRELAVNDPQLNMSHQIGPRNERNVELLIRAPFNLQR